MEYHLFWVDAVVHSLHYVHTHVLSCTLLECNCCMYIHIKFFPHFRETWKKSSDIVSVCNFHTQYSRSIVCGGTDIVHVRMYLLNFGMGMGPCV